MEAVVVVVVVLPVVVEKEEEEEEKEGCNKERGVETFCTRNGMGSPSLFLYPST